MANDKPPSTSGYAAEAADLFRRYESRAAEDVHAAWLHLFPDAPCRVLDVGSGTGRDAAWLASKGHTVTAVEPTPELREPAQKLHPEPNITWLDDALPDLAKLKAVSGTFDLVLMNAVWMHLTQPERVAGMASIAELMAPRARLFMTLRHGPVPEGRRMFEVSSDETVQLAADCGLEPQFHLRTPSVQLQNKTAGIDWTLLAFERPAS